MKRRSPGISLSPLLAILLGMAAVGPASAETDTLRLTLDQAVERVLGLGEEMKLADADLASAKAQYLQARATALPQIFGSGTYTRQIESIFRMEGDGPGFDPFEPDTLAPLEDRVRDLEQALPGSGLAGLASLFSSTAFGSENSWVASVGVTQRLIQGGSIWGSIAAAGHAMRAAREMKQDRADELTLAGRAAYLGALLADRGVRIAELSLDQSESHLERVRLRQQVGEASEFELLQAEVATGNQIPIVKMAKAARETAYLELRRLANLPRLAPLRLESPLLDDAAVPTDPAAVDTTGLEQDALRTSGVKALDEVLQAREDAVLVAKSDLWPDLSLFANYSRQAYPDDLLPKSDEWAKDINVGARAVWNVFDGFRTKGYIQQAKAQRSVARQNLNQVRELIQQSVVQGRLELERSSSDLHARGQTVRLARKAYELAELRYEEGASSLLELNDTRIAYQIAQTNEAQARHDYFLALARLERLSGRPLFTSTVQAVGLSR
ncbi:MAG: TolC family protein [Candidatus Eisenbacteria bacterium]|nr:TolC family protein [Candidatus Eisenbacteria bacterium]